jgi:hypothetical protein
MVVEAPILIGIVLLAIAIGGVLGMITGLRLGWHFGFGRGLLYVQPALEERHAEENGGASRDTDPCPTACAYCGRHRPLPGDLANAV